MSRNEDARTGCPILARAFAFDVGDREYPKQLVEDEDGPRCTAFRPLGQRRHRRTRPVPGQLTLEQP